MARIEQEKVFDDATGEINGDTQSGNNRLNKGRGVTVIKDFSLDDGDVLDVRKGAIAPFNTALCGLIKYGDVGRAVPLLYLTRLHPAIHIFSGTIQHRSPINQQ